MSTIPGVSVTTQVVTRNPIGTSDKIICLIGAAEQASAIGGVFQPFLFTTYNQAASAIGTSTTNGELINMIYNAFNNGAKQVLAVVASVTGSGSEAEYQSALDSIKTYDNLQAVVVEDTSEAVALDLETHIADVALDNRFRRGYVGLPSGSLVADFVSRAQALNNNSMFVVGPNFKNSSNVEQEGGVVAAAAAIVAEKETDPAKPITGSAIDGFNGLALQLVDADYDTLHNGGVYTTSDRGNDRVMRYLTTESSGTNIITEGTISKVKDFVASRLKAILESEFNRSKLTNSVVKQIQSRTLLQLTTWQAKEIVSPDAEVTAVATKDGTDPSKVNLAVTYSAVYPLNFIDLTITLIL
jgi:hypothetical protein